MGSASSRRERRAKAVAFSLQSAEEAAKPLVRSSGIGTVPEWQDVRRPAISQDVWRMSGGRGGYQHGAYSRKDMVTARSPITLESAVRRNRLNQAYSDDYRRRNFPTSPRQEDYVEGGIDTIGRRYGGKAVVAQKLTMTQLGRIHATSRAY